MLLLHSLWWWGSSKWQKEVNRERVVLVNVKVSIEKNYLFSTAALNKIGFNMIKFFYLNFVFIYSSLALSYITINMLDARVLLVYKECSMAIFGLWKQVFITQLFTLAYVWYLLRFESVLFSVTAQKIKFSIKDFFSKCD